MTSFQEQIENENIAKQSVAPFKREREKKNAIGLGGWLLRQCFGTSKEYLFLLLTHTIQELIVQSTVSRWQSPVSTQLSSKDLIAVFSLDTIGIV